MDSLRSDDPEVLGAAVYANSFRTVEPGIQSTGLRTHPFRFDALRHTRDPRTAEEFLINSRLRRRDADLENSIGSYHSQVVAAMLSLTGQESRQGCTTVPLPESIELRMSLNEAIRRRRSIRSYTGDAISLAYMAAIARAACGITAYTPESHGIPGLALRSTPSGGGLYPVDLHLAALHVEDLPRGLYTYNPHRDELWQTGNGARASILLEAFANPDEVISLGQASAICLLVGRPWRSMRKYGARGMRYLFLEAGAMAEQINLVAAALGLGSVDCASFYDDEANEALGIDGLYEAVIHSLVLGVPG